MLTIDQMLDQIRGIIAKCSGSEEEVYTALVSEAEGWEMRLQELENELNDEEDE